jgi:hypothetical protein
MERMEEMRSAAAAAAAAGDYDFRPSSRCLYSSVLPMEMRSNQDPSRKRKEPEPAGVSRRTPVGIGNRNGRAGMRRSRGQEK